MTLIEILLAMAIAVLLSGIVFSVYTAVLLTMKVQGGRRASSSGAALELLSRDLARVPASDGLTNAPVILEHGTNGAGQSRLTIATADPGGAGDLGVYDIIIVQYFLEDADEADDGGYALVRLSPCRDVRPGEAGRFEREALVRGVTRFLVEVFDGEGWTNAWNENSVAPIPRAARVRIERGRGPGGVLASEVLIPAGNRISGRKN